MRAVSQRYLDSLTGSAITTARVRVVNPFNRDGGTGAFNTISAPLPVLAGTVVLDGTADLRMRIEGLQVAPYWPDTGQDAPSAAGKFGSVDVAHPGREVWPFPRPIRAGAYGGAFSPHGNILQVEVGVEFGGGEVEYVRLGYVRIDDIEQTDAPWGPIDVTVSDLHAFLQDARPEYDKTYPTGTTLGDLFTDAVTAYRSEINWAIPTDLDMDPAFAASTLAAPQTMDRESFTFLSDLVASRGCIWYWDSRCKLVIKPTPATDAAPVWDIASGANGNATRIGRRMTRDGVPNVWVVDGEALDDQVPVRYVLWNDASSSSYWAFFCKVTQFYSSPFIKTDAGAESAARSLAASNPGIPYRINAEHVANAALEPYDVCRVWIYGQEDPLKYELHQVESTRIPLVGNAGQTTMRERFL